MMKLIKMQKVMDTVDRVEKSINLREMDVAKVRQGGERWREME